MTVAHPASDCRLDCLPMRHAHEFVTWLAPQNLHGRGWPCAPGGVRRDADDAPMLLHFAPGRWLVPDPGPDILAMLAEAVEAGDGASIGAEGKWSEMLLTGSGALRVLASTIDIEAVLLQRGCAAAVLFDCPTILMAAAGGYRLWVEASHAEDFIAAIGRLHRAG